jgi:hypothetical protein
MENYKIYYIFNKSNQNEYDYFISKNNISKMLYSLRRTKKNTIVKQILETNNYETIIIKTFTNETRENVKNELKKIRLSHTQTDTKQSLSKGLTQTENKFCSTFLKSGTDAILLHKKTKDNSVYNGKIRENTIYELLVKHKVFQIENDYELYKSNYIFSEYDFFDNQYFLYELKTLTYSINKYNTAIMNTSKLIYDNYIFIFEYTEVNKKELYYHFYDAKYNYNKRYITPLNRLNICEIIDIPINKLTKFYDGNQIINISKSSFQNISREHINNFNNIITRHK